MDPYISKGNHRELANEEFYSYGFQVKWKNKKFYNQGIHTTQSKQSWV